MTYLGETLRKAREAKGLTTSQVAQKTRILVQIITEIEQDNFKRIPAAIYGRGFIRQICECLEIDPTPLVAEFMDVYTGRKSAAPADPFMPKKPIPPPPPAPEKATVAETLPPKPVERAPEVPPPPPVEPVAPVVPPPTMSEKFEEAQPQPTASIFDPPPASSTSSIFDPPSAYETQTSNSIFQEAQPTDSIFQESKPTDSIFQEAEAPVNDNVKGLDLFEQVKDTTPPSEAPVEAPPQQRPQDIFASAYKLPERAQPSGPSAAEKLCENLSNLSHDIVGRVRRIPRSTWRMTLLALSALVVISLIVWGCRVLYRVTTTPADPAASTPTTQEIQPAAAPAVAAPTTKTAAKPVKKSADVPVTAPIPKLRSTGQKVPPLYMD